MNLERADASYAAWDKAIVAKSKQTASAASAQTVEPRKEAAETAQSTARAAQSFRTALAAHDDHERHYDATWRTTAAATGSGPAARDPESEEFGFWDFVDIINPLQHIPVVATIYREITGDEISAPARIMGGALYGGPLGFAASIGNAIMEEVTGKDAGEIAMAMVFEDDSSGNEGSVIADASNPAPGPAQTQAARSDAAGSQPPDSTAALPAHAVVMHENAGQKAVLQEMAGNAALQDLLKQMGLTQNAGAAVVSGSALAAQTAAAPPVPVPPGTAPVTAAAIESAANGNRTSGAKPEQQAQAAKPRRSIAIDTSRYINPQATATPKPSVSTTGPTAGSPSEAAATQALPETAAIRTSDDAAANKDAVQASFADRMLQALDRYQAMSEQKTALPSVDAAGQAAPRPGAI